METLELWNKVAKTDPKHTKRVNQRGGFTAIDAHYQVQEATRAFGPIGKGWGYHVDYQFQGDLVLAFVSLWWTEGKKDEEGYTERFSYGPTAGCCELKKNGRTDTDAPKKAMTDGLTKALSHLGFNADVFLGKFDDNKYVNELKKEFAEKPAQPQQQADNPPAQDGKPPHEIWAEDFLAKVEKCKSKAELGSLKDHNRDHYLACHSADKNLAMTIKAHMDNHENSLPI